MKKNKNYFKVIFQTTNPNLFRTTSIGYLYEISQRHRVVLLTVGIDSQTKEILEDKNLFPGLEKIIFLEPPFSGNIFRKNLQLCKTLREAVREYKPDIVVASNDIWPAEMYLLRFAKKAGAITLTLQDGIREAERKKLFLWSCLRNTHIKMPRFLPFFLRLFLVKIRKYLGHFLYYWILPLTVGESPFLGKTSFLFWDESSGLRDADYSAVFSRRDYDLRVKEGVKAEKIFVLGHPLEHKLTKEFFEKTFFSQNKRKEDPKTLTIMLPPVEKVGFKEGDHSLISEKEMRENRVKAVKLISKILPDWKIFIKPHPAVKNVSEIKKFLGQNLNNVSIVEPSEPADKYIGMSSVIVGISSPSMTLFIARKQNPEKIILFLDLGKEFLGNVYKYLEGIEYIDNETKLTGVLDLIRNNEYQKKQKSDSDFDFSDTDKLLDYIFLHHQETN